MTTPHHSCVSCLCAVAALLVASPVVWPADCDVTTVDRTPLNDLGGGLYLGQFSGGLYPAGSNVPPATHDDEGRARALALGPLDVNGEPDPDGKYVLLSIGMSNTTQEFCCGWWTFMGLAEDDERVNHTTLAIANGARGGQAAAQWESPDHPNYDRIRDTVLAPRGLTEAQVRVAWVKVANPGPTVSLPEENSDAYDLLGRTGNIMRALEVRYPNLALVFVSSRIYAGYASTTLNPEPYAYESGFSMKWLIEAQINQMDGGGIDPVAGDLDYGSIASWVGWGAYLWADGLVPRSDGLVWACEDFAADGTHPSMSGQHKVGLQLLHFFLTSPYGAPWFVAPGACLPDLDGSGGVDIGDILLIIAEWGPCAPACPHDLDGNGVVDFGDLLIVLAAWGAC